MIKGLACELWRFGLDPAGLRDIGDDRQGAELEGESQDAASPDKRVGRTGFGAGEYEGVHGMNVM
jgi:hypothetical protein